MIVNYIISILSCVFSFYLSRYFFFPCLAFAILVCIFSIVRRFIRP